MTVWCSGAGIAADESVLRVDWRWTNGVVRAVHGGNNGPLGSGETVDLTALHRELALPHTRLHDSAWPYPDIVDVHAIFPDAKADPDDPASYRFGPTDDYLRAITNVGSRIVYRLGESIEHAKRKRRVHPPADPARWARVVQGIIRHYNEGWADGHRLGIEYWEIWNEPENRPAMWTGTPEQYYALYVTAARAIRARWPRLKVGGPSLGHQGEFRHGRLVPSQFLQGFVKAVRDGEAPLDFFSWHLYHDDPAELARRAEAVRGYLDAEGFRRTESHLNEWNYLPDRDWGPMLSGQGEVRERWYARQGGPEGAAYAAAGLIALQAAPVDVANFYSADNQAFGLFSLHGAPKATFHAFRSFRVLTEQPVRVTAGAGPGVGPLAEAGGAWWLGGLDPARGVGALMVALPRGAGGLQAVACAGWPWAGSVAIETAWLAPGREWAAGPAQRQVGPDFRLDLALPPASVALIQIRRVTP